MGIPQITANSLYEYGNLYLDLQQFISAEKSFHEMLSIAPEGSQDLLALAQYGLAQAFAAQGKKDEARKLGEESVAILVCNRTWKYNGSKRLVTLTCIIRHVRLK